MYSITFVCIPYLENISNALEEYLTSVVKRARVLGGILLFTTHNLKLFYYKFKPIFQNIPTILLLKSSNNDLKFIKEYLGLAENFEDYYSKLNYKNEFLLVEGSKCNICKRNE